MEENQEMNAILLDVIRSCDKAKNAYDSMKRELQKTIGEKISVEVQIRELQKKLQGMSDQSQTFWTDHESRKKSAELEIERKSKQSDLDAGIAIQNRQESERAKENAEKLENYWKDKVKEIDKIRIELEAKKEKARELVTHL